MILVPGRMVEDDDRVDESCPMVGGQPSFPPSCRPESVDWVCQNCHSKLHAITMIPMLMSSNEDVESTLFLFGCLENGCGAASGSWRVYRWSKQVSPSVGPHDEVVSNKKQDHAPSSDPHDTSMCTMDSSWGLGGSVEENGSGFGDLAEQLASLNFQPKDAQHSSLPYKGTGKYADKEAFGVHKNENVKEQSEHVRIITDSGLPAFYLVPHDHERAGARPGTQLSSIPGMEASSSHECFVQDDEKENTGEAGLVSWEGETYEPDAVLHIQGRFNPDEAFLTFMRKLRELPEQCVRVFEKSHEEGIWPSNELPEPGTCENCGQDRQLVAQVLCPLIASIEESFDYIEGASKGKSLRHPPVSWEWATIGISSCLSCSVGGGLQQERVVVIGEA